MNEVVLCIDVSSHKRAGLQIRNNVAQIFSNDALNIFALKLPRDVKDKLIAFGTPHPGQYRVPKILFIESLAERMIGFQRRDGTDVNAATRDPLANKLFLQRRSATTQ